MRYNTNNIGRNAMNFKCLASIFIGLVALWVPTSAAPKSRFCTYGQLKDEAEAFIAGKEQYLDYKPKPLPPRSCDANPLQGLDCDACLVAVEALKIYIETGRSKKEIVELATRICIVFKIEDKRVCTGIVQEFKAELFGVLDELVLSPMEVCGLVVGDGCGDPYNPLLNWNVTFPPNKKPPVVPPVLPKTGSPKFHILHLTDIHTDLGYLAGANAECGEPICCRDNDGTPAPGVPGAGRWGDYRGCDLPTATLNNLFMHLTTIQHKFDFIIFTGDIPAHNVWNQSRTDQINSLTSLTKLFVKYFPEKKVYFAIGNHESAPVNSFPPPFVTGNNSITWLYTAMAESWGLWLPESTVADIVKGAYYTVSPLPGLRLISMNMNYCNKGNWWLLLNTTDPAGELQWLITVLQKAEDKHERVYIMGHIPPGSGTCLKAWSWNYYKIVNRYESTIAAQLFGHTHADYYETFYDDVTFKRPLGVALMPGSVTPETDYNPGYRILEVDGNYPKSSWEILNFDNYFLNLTDANTKENPKWIHEYNAKEAYNMPSLYPRDWNDLINRMKMDDALLNKFYKYRQKSHVDRPCDADCKRNVLCDLRTGRSGDPNLCADL